MQRPALVLTLIALAGRPAPGQQPYRVTWWDAASVAAATAFGVTPEAAGPPHGPPPCAPCDPSSLPGIDRAALHTFSGPASTASTVLLAGVAGFAGLASLDGATAGAARGHAAVLANSLAWTFATTEWLKVLGHRSRPVLYTPAAPSAGPRGVGVRRRDVLHGAGGARAAATPHTQCRAALRRRRGNLGVAGGRGQALSHGCRGGGRPRRRDRVAGGDDPRHGAMRRSGTRNAERGTER